MMTPDEYTTSRRYDPHCLITQEANKAHSLQELQGLVAKTLRVHCPLSALGAFAGATGAEPRGEYAKYLHLTSEQLTPRQERTIRKILIPNLIKVVQHIPRMSVSLPYKHD